MTPLTPSSGMPPYSSALVTAWTARKPGLQSIAPALRSGVAVSSRLSRRKMLLASASLVLRMTLPVKPSVTTTSTDALENIVAFDVAVKIEAARLEQRVGGEGQFVALEFLGAVRHQAGASGLCLPSTCSQ